MKGTTTQSDRKHIELVQYVTNSGTDMFIKTICLTSLVFLIICGCASCLAVVHFISSSCMLIAHFSSLICITVES